jgi:hypothetical protein
LSRDFSARERLEQATASRVPTAFETNLNPTRAFVGAGAAVTKREERRSGRDSLVQ